MRVIVIGNNVAGTTVAKGLRDNDPKVDIDIYTEEAIPYYPRPRLIDYLIGKVQEQELPFYPTEWYSQNNIRIYLEHRAERINRQRKEVMISSKWEPYDKLVLATGSAPFVPQFPGLPKENVFTLKTFEDAKKIKERAGRSTHAIVIGGGLLGLETARGVCTAFPDLRVTILESGEHLLTRQLDHEGADILQGWIEKTGEKVIARAETEEIVGRGETADGVLLKDGREIKGDMILISVGTRPNVSMAKDAGINVNKGIVIDSSIRTSDPDIYALGDVAEFNGQVWAQIPPALDEAKIASRTILGLAAPEYRGTVPSNTLKVVGFDLTSVGQIKQLHEAPEPGLEEIRAVTPDKRIYKKFVIRDGKMIGAILLGTKKEIVRVTKIIKDGEPVNPFKSRLSDPSYTFS